MTGGKEMYENANGVMVPDSVMLRDVHHAFHYGELVTVSELFGDVGPLTGAPCLEAIDDDPTINALLAAANI